MQAIVWTAVNEIEIREVPRPEPGPGEVLVRTSHAGICGSDLHIWHGEHPRAQPPLVLGHEFSGWVEQPPPGLGWQEGQAVVAYPVIGCGECALCRSGREHICSRLGLIGIDRDGGMGEFVCVPSRLLHRLPEGIPLSLGAVIEPMAVGVHAVARCGQVKDATVAIVGAGPIGLCIGLAAIEKGATRVLISDVSDFRLRVAEAFGFTGVNVRTQSFREVVGNATGRQGAGCVFEATGVPAAAEGLLDLAGIGRRIVVAGVFPRPVPVNLRDLSFRELTLIGMRHYTPDDFDRAIRIVASGRFAVENLITGTYPLHRGVEAFHRSSIGMDSVKILVKVGRERSEPQSGTSSTSESECL